jgi:hypothetical protein
MIYVISKATFGSYNVRDIQFNANWDICPYSEYALIPESMVEGILTTRGYCDITLNDAGTEVTGFTAREIPSVPEECGGVNTVLSVNGVTANTSGDVALKTVNTPQMNYVDMLATAEDESICPLNATTFLRMYCPSNAPVVNGDFYVTVRRLNAPQYITVEAYDGTYWTNSRDGNGWSGWKDNSNNKTLLWVNAYTRNGFPAQTITLDLSQYQQVEIHTLLNGVETADGLGFSHIVDIGNACFHEMLGAYDVIETRPARATTTGVEFGGSMRGTTPRDDRMFPYKIYGVKGVKR